MGRDAVGHNNSLPAKQHCRFSSAISLSMFFKAKSFYSLICAQEEKTGSVSSQMYYVNLH